MVGLGKTSGAAPCRGGTGVPRQAPTWSYRPQTTARPPRVLRGVGSGNEISSYRNLASTSWNFLTLGALEFFLMASYIARFNKLLIVRGPSSHSVYEILTYTYSSHGRQAGLVPPHTPLARHVRLPLPWR